MNTKPGRPAPAILTCLFCLAFLSSCIDVGEEFWINPDGSGRMKFEVGMNAQLMAMAALQGEEKNPIGNPFENAESALSEDSNVEAFEVKQETRGDMTYQILDVTVRDLTKVADSFNETIGDEELPVDPFRLTRLENGNYRFVQSLDFDPARDADDAPNLLTAGIMANMFKDRYMTIRINGNIVSANGEIAEDGKSVEWKIALADAAAGRVDLEQAEAEISLGRGWGISPKRLRILGAVAGVILIAAIAFALGRKSRAV